MCTSWLDDSCSDSYDKTSNSRSFLKMSPEHEARNNSIKMNQVNEVDVSFSHNTADLEGGKVGKERGLRHKDSGHSVKLVLR